jgi:hypothetical protein
MEHTMQSKQLNSVAADDNASKAAVSAAYANKAMQHTYTAAQQNAAQRVVDAVSTAYNYDTVYTNYRKKFIAVKFTALRVRDKNFAKQVQQAFAERNYSIVSTAQGTVVRIAR